MIEIINGTIEEQIIKLLQKIYPITINDIEKKLKLSKIVIIRVLRKLEVKGIIQLEPLNNKTYNRLLRNDFSFIGKKRQRKFIKHKSSNKKRVPEEYEGPMFS